MLIICLVIPKSLTWCVAVGKFNRARASLCALYRGTEGYNAENHIQLLSLAIDHER